MIQISLGVSPIVVGDWDLRKVRGYVLVRMNMWVSVRPF